MLVTWLPYPNMRLSVHVLDSQTLGVQIAQSLKLLRMIAGHREGGADRYHATTMSWYHHGGALCRYTDWALQEMTMRGLDRGLPSPRSVAGRKLYEIPIEWSEENPIVPEWIGVERIHASHRAALLKRDRGWYSQFAWHETPVLNLVWPMKMPSVGDTVMQESTREIYLVHSFDEYRRPVLFREGNLLTISRRDVYTGQWRRCVREW